MPLSEKMWLSFHKRLKLLHCIYSLVKYKNQNPYEKRDSNALK